MSANTSSDDLFSPRGPRVRSNQSYNQSSNLSLLSNGRSVTPSSYNNTTFGHSKRMQLPLIARRQEFTAQKSTLDRRFGALSKSPRRENLNDRGRDAPSPSKYLVRDSFARRSRNYSFSFGISYNSYAKVTVSQVRTQHLPSTTPGPGEYRAYKPIGESKPKYSIGARNDWSYMPTTLKNPPVTKYTPEKYQDAQKSQKYSRISLGVGERSFSYIPKKDVPGPASYSLEKSDNLKRIPHYRHVSVERQRELSHIPQIKTPGPGSYNVGANYNKYDWTVQRQRANLYKDIRKSPSRMRKNQDQNLSALL